MVSHDAAELVVGGEVAPRPGAAAPGAAPQGTTGGGASSAEGGDDDSADEPQQEVEHRVREPSLGVRPPEAVRAELGQLPQHRRRRGRADEHCRQLAASGGGGGAATDAAPAAYAAAGPAHSPNTTSDARTQPEAFKAIASAARSSREMEKPSATTTTEAACAQAESADAHSAFVAVRLVILADGDATIMAQRRRSVLFAACARAYAARTTRST